MNPAAFAAAVVAAKFVIDVGAAGAFGWNRQYGLAVMFVGFAVADVGTLLVAK